MSAPTRPRRSEGQDADTVSAARGMAAQRRGGGPPWAGAGQPVEKAMDFGPSARRLVGLLRPERLGVVAVLVLGVISVALNVIGPIILGRATDVIFAGVIGKQLPAGITGEQAAAAGAGGGQRDGRGRDREPARRAGRRHRLRGARARAARRRRDLRRRVACSATCRATCSTASCSARSSTCAATSRTSSTGCRCPTSTRGSAARCSRASPTTSTTSPPACSRR